MKRHINRHYSLLNYCHCLRAKQSVFVVQLLGLSLLLLLLMIVFELSAISAETWQNWQQIWLQQSHAFCRASYRHSVGILAILPLDAYFCIILHYSAYFSAESQSHFFYARSSIRDRERAAEAVLYAKIASRPATKVQLRKINYSDLCRIMQTYAELCRAMQLHKNYAFA